MHVGQGLTSVGRSLRFGRVLVLAAIVAAWLPAGSSAHPLAPSMLRLDEVAPGRVEVTWKTPAQRVPGSRLRPVLPASCQPATKPEIRQDQAAYVTQWPLDCAGSLAGMELGVDGMAESMTDVVVYVDLHDGRTFRTILAAGRPRWTVPAVESPSEVFATYVRFGFEHILSGVDHLAFVLALLLLVGTRRVAGVVTAFTLGHSVTLALSALDVVRVQQRPVEILIALSIALAAREVVRAADDRPVAFARLPSVMAAIFGLLHGLGFAGALREVGLPQEAIPLALLSFNLGIEIGQLAFVLVVLLPLAVLGSATSWARRVRLAGAYGIGSLAFYWVFERTLT